MSNEFRLAEGGRIDRDRPLSFRFDGREYVGYEGDTLASALLANGVHQVGTSIKHGRPRGIMAAGVEEPNALVQIEKPFPEPMLTATTVPLRDGLEATGLPGQGRLAEEADPARYDTMHAHCDVLVVGAGPAGLSAALSAARSGARVIVADADAEFGGSLLGIGERLDDAPATEWVRRAVAELATYPEVRQLPSTTVFGHYDDNYLVAVENRGEDAPSRQRIWRVRAREVVLATGSHERPLVFAGNDRPGTMLAGSARTYLHRYGVVPGRRAVVFTANDSAYAAAVDLHDAGVAIAAIIDVRDVVSTRWASHCIERGIPIHPEAAVVSTSGTGRISHVHVARWETPGDRMTNVRQVIDCDVLLVSGGWNPAVHLHSQSRGTLRFAEQIGAFVPDRSARSVRSAGAAAGVFATADCLRTGAEAGRDAAVAAGFDAEAGPVPRAANPPVLAGRNVWLVPSPADSAGHTQYVDLARDATVADIRRAVGAGLHSVEHVKRYTTIGTAHDQGKTSGILSTGIITEALGRDIADVGTTTFRAPYAPVTFAALAGRDRGDLYDPVRVTAMHDWHVEQGAPFENVGQWKRPWYYPRPGEDMETAVLRECQAVREGVGIQDVSTLGKIDVQGPDAAEFLDLVYTNKMSTLKVGRIRYGLMCHADGMVFDDGTVMRTGENRYLISTTSGGAAGVLQWLEDWLQTEWPHLRVHLTSVTEQWATIALVGPRSREVLARVASEMDLDNDDFPFMAWQDGSVAGQRARVCRISFSGELAFEINVPWWHGREVWDALIDAGAPFGITPYGTETMHVLRAEKGFPIVGQDTDGTVTPHDLGMSWAVSKKKDDFLGMRSFSRADTSRTDRKHLVGLLPADEDLVLEEGAQLVEHSELPQPPVPMLGHVTSSYRSAVLRRGFALALVKGGRDRIGETIYSTAGDGLAAVTITEPVFYDKEGARRDG
ncbi:sarcosine oxidase subunit alpha [Saccharopolyspora erythraea NRRL 2338]|uniref:Sarcosine oxidase subunit alpha n=1 Tax=Saccharopolyspora erythraea (strain ATCC 11635 / DSM 40517 / JCM 4748 / NBRC 13426 / NCIMB 8594 / NRRL 2338) TaxID=405948 RepID=A4FI86_SACEN|nr:sarcosine oxidase subunit alpha family protein [Saccharopolyspora erythraea]EQD83215.1 ferredoxin [Saccharopolyspora erythraea D]PFG97441.1 sarcosine oxidase subunit alpha [Saccharopolyspora erythraea NRRL 2338]QRK87620.1 sarcosine oxidase subunit alpha family protein [Saccharopolyspora erythraea]CAM03761.1 sarcosine oxidase (alpha subunit) oxidoreductase protein [Saccharopolyspora erythraea NRRL 2338]